MYTMQEFKYATNTGFVAYARITDCNNGSFLGEVSYLIKEEDGDKPYKGEYIIAVDPVTRVSSPDVSAFEAFVKINKTVAILLAKENPINHAFVYIDNLCNTPFLSVSDIKEHFNTPPEIRVNGKVEE